MVNSYLNIITFLLSTLFYYMALKPTLNYEINSNPEKYKEYNSNNNLYLAIYFVGVMVIQFMVNTSILTNKCGGNVAENMGASAALTFVPWSLIFGVIIIVLLAYPGFKSAFSDVVGYFYVAGKANELLTELLIDKNVQKTINDDVNATQEQKQAMQEAADAIIKICGNASILINQIVPTNFENYWNILTPLMKTKYQSITPETLEKKNELFDLVATRDNIGEAMWYVYTGILLTSIVQLRISSRPCNLNPKTMQDKYNKFLEEQEEIDQQREKAQSQVYTITN
jgi:uncharacterized membrane protein YkgB